MLEYIHILEEKVGEGEFSYRIKEEVLEYDGRKILCLDSRAEKGITLGCDQTYVEAPETIFVKGHVIEWKKEKENGDLVSKLEPVKDDMEREEIRRILESKFPRANILF